MPNALPEVDALDHSQLVNSRGQSFYEFRRTLHTRWSRVWFDITLGYLVIIGAIVGVAYLEQVFPTALIPILVILGAVVLGYAIAFTQLFLHEAAHFNIAPNRKLNDRMANICIGLMVGQDIKAYRTIHLDHHRYLGTPRDTERSYFAPLDRKFILGGLLGVSLLKNLSQRESRFVAASGESMSNPSAPADNRRHPNWSLTPRRRRLGMLIGGLVLNLGIIAGALATENYAVAIAWPLGMASVHPCINAVRQSLEHRSFDASARVDYSHTAHGPVTRMFGSGLLASTLGGAGFNRHLLHHWQPQISYTCLPELERYVLDTASAPLFQNSTTSYRYAFGRLTRASSSA